MYNKLYYHELGIRHVDAIQKLSDRVSALWSLVRSPVGEILVYTADGA